jgi:hypothetical protein
MENVDSTSSLQVGRAFSFMFEDKDWVVKILPGAFFTLFTLALAVGVFRLFISSHFGTIVDIFALVFGVLVSPILFGYLLELAKNSSEGKEIPLPEWNNLGDKFVRGLVYFVILIIYSIPGMILSFIPCVKFCLGPLYFLALAFVLPYITVKYAQTGSFEEVFRFNEIIGFVKNNLSNLVIVILLNIALGIIATFGVLALVVGIFFTMFWADLGIFYLYGQVYREGKKEKPATQPVSS